MQTITMTDIEQVSGGISLDHLVNDVLDGGIIGGGIGALCGIPGGPPGMAVLGAVGASIGVAAFLGDHVKFFAK